MNSGTQELRSPGIARWPLFRCAACADQVQSVGAMGDTSGEGAARRNAMTDSAPPGTPAAAVRLAGHMQRAAKTAIAHNILRPRRRPHLLRRSGSPANWSSRSTPKSAPTSAAPARPRSRGLPSAPRPSAAQGPGTLAEMAFDYAAGARTLLAWYPDRPLFAGTARPAASTSPTTARPPGPCPTKRARPAAASVWPPKPASGSRRDRDDRTTALRHGRASSSTPPPCWTPTLTQIAPTSSSSGKSLRQRSAKPTLCWPPQPRWGSAPAWDHSTSGNGGILPQHGQSDHLAAPPADLVRVCSALCTGDNRRQRRPSAGWFGGHAWEPPVK